jgi:hypothetical protein
MKTCGVAVVAGAAIDGRSVKVAAVQQKAGVGVLTIGT